MTKNLALAILSMAALEFENMLKGSHGELTQPQIQAARSLAHHLRLLEKAIETDDITEGEHD